MIMINDSSVGFLAIKVVKQNLAQKFHLVFTLPVALYVALRPITANYITSFPNIYYFYMLLQASRVSVLHIYHINNYSCTNLILHIVPLLTPMNFIYCT